MSPAQLRRLRTRLGLTQKAFAELVGIAENSIARMERGELGMRRTTVRLIQLIAAQHEQDVKRGKTPPKHGKGKTA